MHTGIALCRAMVRLLAFLLVLSTAPASTAGESGIPGDLDGDCDVDRLDLNLIIVNRDKTVEKSSCGAGCDLDGDGVVTDLDAQKLVRLCTAVRCATLDSTCDCLYGEVRPCKTACGAGTEICAAGAWQECTAPDPTEETCDGLDNDCDGEVDEGLLNVCGGCGPVPEEICDGADNDCDGETDEQLTRSCDTACGAGTELCSAGVWQECSAPQPVEETCDGLDNDCDGELDEELSRSCGTECGAGTETCSSGEWQGCGAPQPAEETCDGVDNDCDGEIDEGVLNVCGACGLLPEEVCDAVDNDCDGVVDEELSRSCESDCGAGTELCVAGVWQECSAPPPVEEICDGLDNDCDGEPDEELSRSCGTICGAGTELCAAGVWQECSAPEPAEETCDEVDNDCDGEIDEGLLNACGACGPVPEEVCDGVDNDCDGALDEELSRSCDTACGAGTELCAAGAWGECSAPEPAEETCDEVDNDCDGEIDEGLLNVCGACGPVPEEVCDGVDNDCDSEIDEEVLNACGSCGPVPDEVCDGLDNDCDGETDEGVLNVCGSCGPVSAEICDGFDNDCDGDVDEGLLNACGACGPLPEEVCDHRDNDCDGQTDEGLEQCPNQAPRIASKPRTEADVDHEYAYPVMSVDTDGDQLKYSLVAPPAGMEIDQAGVIHWTPTAEQISDFDISVKVEDGFGGVDTQTYGIRVSAQSSGAAQRPPIAHAGDDYTVEEGAQDVLDGYNSFDADGDYLHYSWVQIGGPEVELDDPNQEEPAFTAPAVDRNVVLTFSLTVNDGTVDSEADQVQVTILNTDLPPEGNGVVTNSSLEGPGSLKAAIEYANDHPGTRITFDIPDTDPRYDPLTGVWKLPNAQMHRGGHLEGDGVTLDGYSQTENHGDRNPFGPEIEIDRSGQAEGFMVSGDDAVVRGIAFNTDGPLHLCMGSNIIVVGSHIGIDATGTSSGTQRRGIRTSYHECIEWAAGLPDTPPYPDLSDWSVRIGGSRPGQGNLVAGRGWAIQNDPDQSENPAYPRPGSLTIQGNLINLDRTGKLALVHSDRYSIEDRSPFTEVLIGGVSSGSRNVIASGLGHVRATVGAADVVIQGNYIGTDITGSVDIPGNDQSGIELSSGRKNEGFTGEVLIGGSLPGAGNVISGSDIGIRPGLDNRGNDLSIEIKGNLIGTDATGTRIIETSNRQYGIFSASYATDLQIGGRGPHDGNTIGGMVIAGIHVSSYNRSAAITGNRIGVGADGVTPIPNRDGISIGWNNGGSSRIGGIERGAGNVIAHNDRHGIYKMVESPYVARARILSNQIYANGDLGISGGANTTNTDPWIQNYPKISQTLVEDGMVRVQGVLHSVKPESCLVELFANRAVDPGGYGEGRRWVGAVPVSADGSFETVIPEDLSGLYLTSTATRMSREEDDPDLNTSGFSPGVLIGDVPSTNEPPTITSDPVMTATAETAYGYQLTAADPEGDTLSYALALAPEGMAVDPAGLLSWTPAVDQAGQQTVTVVVRDSEGLHASQNFQIQVLPLTDAEPPVASVMVPPEPIKEAP